MRWIVHGERSLYTSAWVNLALVDVEVPGGDRFDHHAVRFPRPAAGAVVHDPARGVLLLWRHRFITDAWGWEIPAGAISDGEQPVAAAARETLEETGWRPGPLRPLFTYNPAPGGVDQAFHVFAAASAERVGEPEDWAEVERVEWLPTERVREEIRGGCVVDGFSLSALLWYSLFELG